MTGSKSLLSVSGAELTDTSERTQPRCRVREQPCNGDSSEDRGPGLSQRSIVLLTVATCSAGHGVSVLDSYRCEGTSLPKQPGRAEVTGLTGHGPSSEAGRNSRHAHSWGKCFYLLPLFTSEEFLTKRIHALGTGGAGEGRVSVGGSGYSAQTRGHASGHREWALRYRNAVSTRKKRDAGKENRTFG